MRRVLPLLIVAAALAAGSCSPGTAQSGARPSVRSTATLTIVEPTANQVFDTGNVPVKLTLVGGQITHVVTKHITPNVGHIHLRIDGQTITLLGSLAQTIPNVSKGTHVLEAEFVAADHGPWQPRIVSAVNFTVK